MGVTEARTNHSLQQTFASEDGERYRLGHTLTDYFLSFLLCVSFILEAGCKCGGLI